MLKNYLKIAFRNLLNQKIYSTIKIFGLSIGISACVLVALYIKQDLSYDKYHKNAAQIYRIGFSSKEESKTFYMAQSPALLGQTLKNIYPEIKSYSRIYFSGRILFNAGSKKNFEDRIAYADSTFFRIFSYDALVGDKTSFLKKTNSIVLTESMAKKYFGNQNPLGKLVEIDGKFDYEVTGVIKDVPKNSHFSFDFIACYSSLDKQPVSIYLPQWGATFGSYTYILTGNGFEPKEFEKKAVNFFKAYTEMVNVDWKINVTPMLDIHLNSHLDDEIEENSSVLKIIILSAIAMFILILAGINFINLSIARSSKRAAEIGVRKVLGAFKAQIIEQFLCESVLFSLVSFLFSCITVILVLPSFSQLIGLELGLNLNNNWITILLIFIGVILLGVFTGLSPALIISSYQPAKVIKGNNPSGIGKGNISNLRRGLVILQFTISMVLITGTIIVNLQLSYLRNYNMGFDKEYMIVLPTYEKVGKNYESLKSELDKIPGVLSTTAGGGSPISGNNFGASCRPHGVSNLEGSFPIIISSIDYDYMNHFGVKFIAGRNFSKAFSTDFPNAMVINEKMVKSLGFTNPQDAIGKSYFISLNGFTPKIIGVTKDFNSTSLHNEIGSQVFMVNPNWFSEFVIKIKSENLTSTIDEMKGVWVKFFPKYPFEYNFLDESIDKLYKSEEKYSQVIFIFSTVALFIACLGLLGLTSFITELRKKEIGIRKVLGAPIKNIIQIISGEFVILVIIANIIAVPVAYYFMNKWLEDFAYRIEISWWIFILSGGISLLIALATVSFQTIKAATANPVDSLKYE
ncbi:MAG: ABC transporter permease [Ignavibacteriales bacterium]|nr:MAG: ABC transporter permease [Ignavibacteriales bacterium]